MYILGIFWILNISLLIIHMVMYEPNPFSIVALTGTALTGVVPGLKSMIGDIEVFGFELGALIHVLSGVAGAVGVGLALGDDSMCNNFKDWGRILLLMGAAISNIISNGAAHQYFIDDRRGEYKLRDMGDPEIYLWIGTGAMSIVAALTHFGSDKRMDSQNIYNMECEDRDLYWLFIISPVLIASLSYAEYIYNSSIRYYIGAAIVVISSFAVTLTGYYLMDAIIFGLILLRMVVIHYANSIKYE
mgnify:CR=1 FL=1